MPKRITFILPGPGNIPVGGPKVVYEYGNGLARRGHAVTIVHPATPWTNRGLVRRGLTTARYLRRRADNSYLPDRWFAVDKGVELRWTPTLNEACIPDADIVFATAWPTAQWVASYPPEKGEKYYLIQHFESWSGSGEDVISTWRLPLKKIVISKWLLEMASSLGQRATYIPNGLDFNAFGADIQPESRDPLSVMMLVHHLPWKGTRDGVTALEIARERVPALKVTLFGTERRPRWIPRWMAYHRNPLQARLRQLYNASAIFVAPSWSEGWDLTASEALACGNALAATAIAGHMEYAVHDRTALLSPAKAPEELAANVVTLLENQRLRVRLATDGLAEIHRFTWERAVAALASEIGA